MGNGAHLIKVATKMDRAPFWAVIGPEVEITAGEAERDSNEDYWNHSDFHVPCSNVGSIGLLGERDHGKKPRQTYDCH